MNDNLLLALLNKEYFNPNHAKELFQEAIDAFLADYKKSNVPVYQEVTLSGSQPYKVNYNNRKHIFAYNPTNTAIPLTSSDNFWSTSLPGNTWTNISFPEGVILNSATPTQFYTKCTNEVTP